jgi:hypothetical protein
LPWLVSTDIFTLLAYRLAELEFLQSLPIFSILSLPDFLILNDIQKMLRGFCFDYKMIHFLIFLRDVVIRFHFQQNSSKKLRQVS